MEGDFPSRARRGPLAPARRLPLPMAPFRFWQWLGLPAPPALARERSLQLGNSREHNRLGHRRQRQAKPLARRFFNGARIASIECQFESMSGPAPALQVCRRRSRHRLFSPTASAARALSALTKNPMTTKHGKKWRQHDRHRLNLTQPSIARSTNFLNEFF